MLVKNSSFNTHYPITRRENSSDDKNAGKSININLPCHRPLRKEELGKRAVRAPEIYFSQ